MSAGSDRKESADISKDILFHKYRILSLLGSGSSSRVYLVEHLKLNSYRAVKCISRASCRQDSLLPEASLLKSLKHPGIPRIYDVKQDNDYFYIIEEYIQGESLLNLVQNQSSISHSLMISIGIQLCSLIEYLHQQKPAPILYLDLKPEHIILCGNQIKLIDFGISSPAAPDGNLCQSYASFGFSAPEQRLRLKCSVRTDIYAIGAILYFMLTKRIMTFPFSDYFRLWKYCSPKFFLLIIKATALFPALRYRSAGQFGKALKKTSALRMPSIPKAHLLEHVAILGSQPRIGTTHFSIAFVCWLNQQGITAVYEEAGRGGILEQLRSRKAGFAESEGYYCYGDFRGIPPDSKPAPLSSGVRILDCGLAHPASLAGFDLVILLAGSRAWEQVHTIAAVNRLSCPNAVRFVCNYQSTQDARMYTQLFQQTVYCFPLDENPFSPTPAKDYFFQLLLSGQA